MFGGDQGSTALLSSVEAYTPPPRTFTVFRSCFAHVSYRLGRYDDAERYAEEAEAASRTNDVHTWAGVRAIQVQVARRRRASSSTPSVLPATASTTRRTATSCPYTLTRSSVLGQVLSLAGRPAEAAAPLEEAAGLLEQKGDIVSAARTHTPCGTRNAVVRHVTR